MWTRNIILKNQMNSFTITLSKSKRLQKWPKMFFFGPVRPNFALFFTISFTWLLNMRKYIILKNQKKSFTRKNSKSKKLQKKPKMAIFWPYKAKFWPFFTIFLQMTSKNAHKHHIENQKNSFTGKVFKSKKLKKRPKNGCFFGPGGPKFDPFFQLFH